MHRGTLQCEIPLASSSSSYSSNIACFTHSPHSALVASSSSFSAASTIASNSGPIRHLSLHDNRILRVYRGHTDGVTCIEMHPLDDGFISGSVDGSVRLWDLRDSSPMCHGKLQLSSQHTAIAGGVDITRPTLAIDPTGMVFAVGSSGSSGSGLVRLFDMRQHDRGPFATWIVPQDTPAAILGMVFSPDGREILCTTDIPSVLVLDAYSDTSTTLHEIPLQNQQMQQIQQGSANSTASGAAAAAAAPITTNIPPPCATYTPDGKYMLVPDGSSLRILSRSSSWKKAVLTRDDFHAHALTGLIWNPTMCAMISSCTNTVLWLPSS